MDNNHSVAWSRVESLSGTGKLAENGFHGDSSREYAIFQRPDILHAQWDTPDVQRFCTNHRHVGGNKYLCEGHVSKALLKQINATPADPRLLKLTFEEVKAKAGTAALLSGGFHGDPSRGFALFKNDANPRWDTMGPMDTFCSNCVPVKGNQYRCQGHMSELGLTLLQRRVKRILADRAKIDLMAPAA